MAEALAGLLLATTLAAEPLLLRAGEPAELRATMPDPRWFLLEPVAADYENPLPCPDEGRCDVPLRWRWRELEALRGQARVQVDQTEALQGPGTRRVLAAAEAPQTTDPEDPRLVTLVVRADDTYVGLASELIGVPFVLNPTTLPDGRHQTDARLGADCVALVIYGQRRLGRSVPYVAPRALARFTAPVQGPVLAGDVLDFGFQTAILAEDRGVLGVVDGPDLVLHSYHGLAELSTFSALPYHEAALTLRRWPR